MIAFGVDLQYGQAFDDQDIRAIESGSPALSPRQAAASNNRNLSGGLCLATASLLAHLLS